MTYIRLIAAAATAIGVAFALSPASARSCNDGEAACATVAQQAAPMQLDNFMKTWKPVAVSKHKGKSKSARRRAAKEAVAEAKSKPAASESEVAQAKPEPAVAETAPPAEAASTLAASSEKTGETDGVAVTSFTQPNELDAAADGGHPGGLVAGRRYPAVDPNPHRQGERANRLADLDGCEELVERCR